MAISGSLDAERRRASLVLLAQADGGVTIEQAAQRFDVSTMTIRRDLMDLEAEGLVRRVRGGAVGAPAPRPFDERQAMRAGAKRTIARKAMALMPGSGAVALDASTTISTVAATLGPRRNLTVCTNSSETFVLLVPLGGVHPVLTGGEAELSTGSLVGPIAHQSARTMFYDIFFTSAGAFNVNDGTSEVSVLEAEIKRAFAANSHTTVLCVDSSKLGGRSLARAIDLTDISTLVTDLDPGDPRLDDYRMIAEIL